MCTWAADADSDSPGYLSQDDHANAGARAAWIQKIEDINAWLEEEVWHTDDGSSSASG